MSPNSTTTTSATNLAALTTGYTPHCLENLFDEALVRLCARGSRAMNLDVHAAPPGRRCGPRVNPSAYTDHEARPIATHEAGHAVVAHIVAPQRRLEVPDPSSNARDALGLLAHNDTETSTRVAVSASPRSRSCLAMVAESCSGRPRPPEFRLNYATTVAAQMVKAAGMVGSLINPRRSRAVPASDTNFAGRVIAHGPSVAASKAALPRRK